MIHVDQLCCLLWNSSQDDSTAFFGYFLVFALSELAIFECTQQSANISNILGGRVFVSLPVSHWQFWYDDNSNRPPVASSRQGVRVNRKWKMGRPGGDDVAGTATVNSCAPRCFLMMVCLIWLDANSLNCCETCETSVLERLVLQCAAFGTLVKCSK